MKLSKSLSLALAATAAISCSPLAEEARAEQKEPQANAEEPTVETAPAESASVDQDSAVGIISPFEKQKVSALKAYLAKNPDAADRNQAVSMMIDSSMILGDGDTAQGLLRERYDSMPKGADAPVQEMMAGAVGPLLQIYAESGNKEEALAFIATVEKDLAAHPAAPQIGQFLGQMKGQLSQPQVGDSLDIAFTSTDGEEIDLSKPTGKVVLVDFWATWCGPCIAEMPNVVSAYEELHEQGFDVVGISLDQEKTELDAFVEKYKMPWPQYFDGKGWENDIAQAHGIRSIPATFLLGKDGKIIASNLRGPQLEEAVKKALAVE